MLDEGWIKLHRRFLEWEWHDSPETVSLFVFLLLEANHEEKKWHGISIARGQVLTSLKNLSVLTGLTIRQLRTCFSRLEQTGEISRKTTSQYTLVTISNYDKYQVREEQQRQTSDTPPTNERQTTDKRATTNKNNKNDKNERIDDPLYGDPAEKFSEDWRFVSSVRRAELGFDKDRIADYKRQVFTRQADAIAPKIGMTAEQKEAFLRWWTEHSPGSDKIKADFEQTFDIRSRMQNWIERDGRARGRQQTDQRSKVQKTIDARTEFQDWVNGTLSHGTPTDGDADSQLGR